MELPRHDNDLMKLLTAHVTRKCEKRDNIRVDNVELVSESEKGYQLQFTTTSDNKWVPHSVVSKYDWTTKKLSVLSWFAQSNNIRECDYAILLKKTDKASLYKLNTGLVQKWVPKRFCMIGPGFVEVPKWIAVANNMIKFKQGKVKKEKKCKTKS